MEGAGIIGNDPFHAEFYGLHDFFETGFRLRNGLVRSTVNFGRNRAVYLDRTAENAVADKPMATSDPSMADGTFTYTEPKGHYRIIRMNSGGKAPGAGVGLGCNHGSLGVPARNGRFAAGSGGGGFRNGMP